jgi:hypothetical protein
MSLRNKDQLIPEQRKYLRLDSVFPVQFRLETPDGKVFLSDWLQGFTNNLGRGGMCLSINNLNLQLLKLLEGKKAKLSLEIDILISSKPISARGSVAWVKDVFGDTRQYLVGVHYDQISKKFNSQLMRYVWVKKLFGPVALSLVIILALVLGINSWVNIKLTRGNQLLVEELVLVLKDSNLAKQKIAAVVSQREDFQARLRILEERIKSAESRKIGKEISDLSHIQQLNDLISGLREEKLVLEGKLTAALRKENVATQELLQLDQKKVVLEKANLDKMYQWLAIHQNNRTGLVMSFEGDKDIANWAFTYDQALLVQAYTQFSDFTRANKILEFFAKHAARKNGWFLNAYYVNDGTPIEFVMHSGPNIWLGIAIMQYTQKTRDQSYLGLAQSIAQTIMNLQDEDADGGIRGNPAAEWYSTEHNLDAYAFFNMLAKVTGEKIYSQAARKTLNWLVGHTYDRQDLPVNRGKGDSTIATDTYAWSIAAIGPQKLQELGLDPDKIMEFVEESCGVEVNFVRPNAQSVKIKGFDFAPQRHMARGGVVSSEWTAQMIVSYKIMQKFYAFKGDLVKAGNYDKKAEMYLGELGKMIISSASPSGQGEGCLPYATQDQVDTGHGWRTPKGSYTGSLSATAYTLFAYYGFNPLELKE